MSESWEEYIENINERFSAEIGKVAAIETELESLIGELRESAQAVGRAHSNEPGGDTHDLYMELMETAHNIEGALEQIDRIGDWAI